MTAARHYDNVASNYMGWWRITLCTIAESDVRVLYFLGQSFCVCCSGWTQKERGKSVRFVAWNGESNVTV
jgi:hypothetical protein